MNNSTYRFTNSRRAVDKVYLRSLDIAGCVKAKIPAIKIVYDQERRLSSPYVEVNEHPHNMKEDRVSCPRYKRFPAAIVAKSCGKPRSDSCTSCRLVLPDVSVSGPYSCVCGLRVVCRLRSEFALCDEPLLLEQAVHYGENRHLSQWCCAYEHVQETWKG